MRKEYFEKRAIEFKKKYIDEKRKYNIHSYMRVILLVSSVFFLYKFYEDTLTKNYLYAVLSGVAAVFFCVVVYKGINIKKRINNFNERKCVCDRFVARFQGKWIEFEDDGEEFIDKKHRYSSDLDIFGKKSLFQFINSTVTAAGRLKLAEILMGEKRELENIKRRNEWVDELSSDIELCEKMACSNGALQEKKSIDIFKAYLRDNHKTFKNLNIKVFLNAVVCIDILILLLSLQVSYKFRMIMLILTGLIHAFLTTVAFLKADRILVQLKSFLKGIERYEKLARILKDHEFKGESLKKVYKELFEGEDDFYSCLKKLDGIEQKVNMRSNIFIFIIYNILLLGDFRWILLLEDWREVYRGRFEKWLDYIAEFEAVVSLSVIAQVRAQTISPKIQKAGVELKFNELSHPLINEDEVVANDGVLSDRIMVITGSNMSGKTTYLRTIGINLVLAYSGGVVCGKGLECSVFDIFTSMRIEDDLNEGLSTFYYELKRIKGIIEFSKESKSMIFLIDEIFRGTNSKDRIIGAQSVMNGLDKPWIIGGITTHDFELCSLENSNESKVVNMHFEEQYEEDTIKFDYKIRKGKATTANAQYLMRLVGIDIDEEF